MTVIDIDEETESSHDLVGPVIRSGHLAEAIIDAVEEDNPDQDVMVLDRGDYVRVHTIGRCRLRRTSLEKALGQSYPLESLEIDMPSFRGRMKTRTDEYLWYYENYGQE